MKNMFIYNIVYQKAYTFYQKRLVNKALFQSRF